MRYALCGIMLINPWYLIGAEAETAAEVLAEDADELAVRDEIEKEVKESKGTMSFDTLFAIWDKTTKATSKAWSKTRDVASKGGQTGAELLALIPKSLLTSLIQKEAGIKNVSITSGPVGYKNSLYITGTTTAAGKPVFVTLLYAPKVPDQKRGGNSLSFGVPAGTPLDQLIPGANVSALGTVPITDMRVVVSDFDYTDPNNSYPIVSGANILVGLDPTAMNIFNPEKLKDLIDIQGGSILGVATITKSTQEEKEGGKGSVATTFKVIVPPTTIKLKKFKLSTLVDTLNIPVPDKIKSELARVELDQLNIAMDFTPNYQSFDLSGVADLFGVKNVKTDYKIYKADRSSTDKGGASAKEGTPAQSDTVLVNELLIEMPDSWSIAQQIPELTMLESVSAKDQRLLLVSRSHQDLEGVDVPAGVSYSGVIQLDKLGDNQFLRGLGNVLGNDVILRGTLSTKLSDSKFEVAIGENRIKEAKVSLGDLVPSKFAPAKKDLSKIMLSLGEFTMKIDGADNTQSIRVTGKAAMGNTQFPVELRANYKEGEWKSDLILTMEQKAPEIEALDMLESLPFSSMTFALIQDPFVDPVSGMAYEEGLNIGGYLSFTGDLSFVKKLFPIKGLDGLNISGVIEKLDPAKLVRNIKLEASIPGAGSLKIGSVTMSSPRLYISLGTTTAFGIEGSMTIPIPKEFRPKGDVSRSPAKTAYTPVTIADIATSMDVEEPNVDTTATGPVVYEAPISAASTVTDQDIFIIEDTIPAAEEQAEFAPAVEEEPSPEDLSPLPELVSVEEDLSVYDAPVGDNKNLTLTGSLAVAGEAGVMSCEMDGVVDILGLILKNVAFEGQVVIAAPPIPTGLGFRADMQIGTGPNAKTINFAAKMAVGSTTTSYAWFGSFKGGLYLSDLVNLSYNVAKRAPKSTQKMRDDFFGAMNKIPKLGIDELEIAIVPIPTTIVGRSYEVGTLFDMKFVLFGAHGLAKAKMGLTGMELEGAIDKITIPSKSPLVILSNFDGSKGPSVRFIVGSSDGVQSLVKNQFSIDGSMEIKPLGMKSATQVLMTPTGGEFKMVEKMYGIYETELEGSLPGTHITKTRLKGKFKQDGLTKLSKMLRDACNDFINESDRELNKVRDELIKTYDDKINTQRAIVRQERERATAELNKANQKAQIDIKREEDKTRAEIARLKKKISDKENECKRASWYRKADVCLTTGAQITGYGAQLAAQETYLKGLLRPGKDVAKGTLGAAKDIVNVTPIDSDPRVASLITAKETALAGIKIGNISAQGLGEIGKALATLGDQAVNLKSVTLDANVADLMRLKLPKFSIEGIFFGKKLHIKELEIDLSNKKTLDLLVGKILNLVKKIG